MTDFPKRHVLGEGYPWPFGFEGQHKSVGLCVKNTGLDLVFLDFPEKLYLKGVPKYRLVLERVDDE